MDTGELRTAGRGAGEGCAPELRRRLAFLAALLALAATLWLALGMDRGVLLATGVRSRAWPWAPLMAGRGPEGQVLSDPVWQFVPWLHLGREELRAGRLPLWNPHQNGGQPLLP